MIRFFCAAIAILGTSHIIVVSQELAQAERLTVDDTTKRDYTVQYSVAGRTVSVVVPTLTKFDSRVLSTVDSDAEAHGFIYRYAIQNVGMSKQSIGQFEMTLHLGVTVDRPAGWKSAERPTTASWIAASDRSAIAPGAMLDGFAVRSPYLPGIAYARLRGWGQAPTVPPSAPAEVRNQISQFLAADVVQMFVIAPMIAITSGESGELLIRRVQSHFVDHLGQHPFAVAIMGDFEAAALAAREGKASAAEAALRRIATVARSRNTALESSNLDTALSITSTYLANMVR